MLPDWGLMFFVGWGFIVVVLNQGLTLQRPVWPRNHYATQAGLKLKATLLPQPPKCWHKSPYLIFWFFFFVTAAQATLQLKTFPLLLECWDYRHVIKTPGLLIYIYLVLFFVVFCLEGMTWSVSGDQSTTCGITSVLPTCMFPGTKFRLSILVAKFPFHWAVSLVLYLLFICSLFSISSSSSITLKILFPC